MSKDSMYAQVLDEMRDVNPVQPGVGRYAMADKVNGACVNCGQPKSAHPVSPELQCPEYSPR